MLAEPLLISSMSATAIVQASIDHSTKNATEKVLRALGMTPDEAIRLFYRQIALRRQFPIELRVPNKLTAAVLSKSDRDESIKTFSNSADLYASWEK